MVRAWHVACLPLRLSPDDSGSPTRGGKLQCIGRRDDLMRNPAATTGILLLTCLLASPATRADSTAGIDDQPPGPPALWVAGAPGAVRIPLAGGEPAQLADSAGARALAADLDRRTVWLGSRGRLSAFDLAGERRLTALLVILASPTSISRRRTAALESVEHVDPHWPGRFRVPAFLATRWPTRFRVASFPATVSNTPLPGPGNVGFPDPAPPAVPARRPFGGAGRSDDRPGDPGARSRVPAAPEAGLPG